MDLWAQWSMYFLMVLNRLLCRSWASNQGLQYLRPASEVKFKIVSHKGNDWVPNQLLKYPTAPSQAQNSEPAAHTPQQCTSPPLSNPALPTPSTGEDGMQGVSGFYFARMAGIVDQNSRLQSLRYVSLPQPQEYIPCRIQLLPLHSTSAGQFRTRRTCCVTSRSTLARNSTLEGQMLSLNMKSQNSMMPFLEANSRNYSLSYWPPPQTLIMLKCDQTASSSSCLQVLAGLQSGFWPRGQNMSVGTQLAPLQQTGCPLTRTVKWLAVWFRATVLMPQGKVFCCTSAEVFLLTSFTTNSQMFWGPIPLGHHSLGLLISTSAQVSFWLMMPRASMVPLCQISQPYLSQTPGPSLASTLMAKFSTALAYQIFLFRIHTQSRAMAAYCLRYTGFHKPRLFRQGAQSHEYWQAGLRVCAYTNGIEFLTFAGCSYTRVGANQTSSRFQRSQRTSSLSSTTRYSTNALLVSASSLPLTIIFAYVSRPWKTNSSTPP